MFIPPHYEKLIYVITLIKLNNAKDLKKEYNISGLSFYPCLKVINNYRVHELRSAVS